LLHLSAPATTDGFGAALDSEWLLAGLSRLPEEQRVALLLHDVHGYSVRELSAITKCPEGTVKARLHYARKKVQEILICPDEEASNE
jgi:RNA polymerase sigma-70 factor (ECF subfamily)